MPRLQAPAGADVMGGCSIGPSKGKINLGVTKYGATFRQVFTKSFSSILIAFD
jgi:hypothetical protein